MIQVTTPHQSSRGGKPVRLVVIHADAGKSDAGTVAWIKDPKSSVSYHYLVGRDGQVYQFVAETKRAWHAGDSRWPDCTTEIPGRKPSVNDYSIGVAFANDGTEAYQPAQYVTGAELVADICRRHKIAPANVVGHVDVSPGRKTDPYKHFDWPKFRALVAGHNTERAPE